MDSSLRDITQNLSLYEDTLKFYLVIDNDDDRSEAMQYAREKLQENIVARNIMDVTSEESLKQLNTFTKKHIIVLNKFEGDFFESITKSRALVLGPRTIISCLMENVTIPSIRSPMFNLAMRDLIVCLSSFDVQQKQDLRKLINYMGGHCIDQLTDTVTHLVTDSVRTKKYEVAVMREMKIMKSSWVHDVWKCSTNDTILATNPKFDVHKVPAFYNLNVTTTGLNRKEKGKIEQLVKEHGGKYYGEFSGTVINIVIAKKNSEETAKLKAALNAHKDCLSPDWIIDSARKGAALPLENYRIDIQLKRITSTPEKQSNAMINNTIASVNISNIPYQGIINDSAMSDLSVVSSFGGRKSNEGESEQKNLEYKAIIEKLNIQDAKKAGHFLDGCNIFICGFTPEEKEKIVKILNAGFATRFDTVHQNLSHILVGNPSKKDLTMMQVCKTDAIFVKLDWLVDSIAQKAAIVDCEPYLYRVHSRKTNEEINDPTLASPASKRNILSMSGQLSKAANRTRLDFGNADSEQAKMVAPPVQGEKIIAPQALEKENLENDLINQYSQVAVQKDPEPVAGPSGMNDFFKPPKAVAHPPTEPEKQSENYDSECSSMTQTSDYLQNLKVFIHGFDEESMEVLITDCKASGAEVILDGKYKGIVDYLILPLDAISMDGLTIEAKHIVNHNWVINSKRINECTDIPYFYEPIFFPEDIHPLANLVVVISLYSNDERSYLVELAQILGAEVQESLIRSNRPFLICPEPRSAKYDAAIRWNLPVVNRHWLMDCQARRKRVSLKNYLVGDSILPVDDVEDEDDVIVSSQSVESHDGINAIPKKSKEAPVINRRVEQLRNTGAARAKATSILDNDEDGFYKNLDTPIREAIRQSERELNALTPQSKRRRFEGHDVATPEYATTPYLIEKKRQILEERRTKYMPTEEQSKKKHETTPWSEYKRRFWKEALGDDYESPSQCYSKNTQEVSQINETITSGHSTGRQLQFEIEADENIEMLKNFIKNRNQENQQHDDIQNIALPNTVISESEMPYSEPQEVVGWRDPSEALIEENAPKKPEEKRRVFLISCATDFMKEDLIRKINSLGGEVSKCLDKYDHSCTHFIAEKPSRSEKMMSSISAGKWVLNLNFVHRSFEAGHFLGEELFEWGNPKAAKDSPQELNPTELITAKAAHRWRKKIESSSGGAFKDFRLVLKTSKNDGIRTLIEAGGGKTINIDNDKPLNKQLDVIVDATHVVCQPKYTKLSPEELKAMKQISVRCVSMNYLQAHLINEVIPDASAFEFK